MTDAAFVVLEMPTTAQSEVVKLNVGGRRFMTRMSTITPTDSQGNFLASLARGDFGADKDDEGYLFVDRSPEYFEVVLDYLRSGTLWCPIHLNRKRLMEEIRYFCVATEKEADEIQKKPSVDLSSKMPIQAPVQLLSSDEINNSFEVAEYAVVCELAEAIVASFRRQVSHRQEGGLPDRRIGVCFFEKSKITREHTVVTDARRWQPEQCWKEGSICDGYELVFDKNLAQKGSALALINLEGSDSGGNGEMRNGLDLLKKHLKDVHGLPITYGPSILDRYMPFHCVDGKKQPRLRIGRPERFLKPEYLLLQCDSLTVRFDTSPKQTPSK